MAAAAVPVGSTQILNVAVSLSAIVVLSLLALLKARISRQSVLLHYAVIYFAGLAWLILTTAISGDWTFARIIIPFMAAIGAFLLAASNLAYQPKAVEYLVFGLIASGLFVASVIFQILGLSYFDLTNPMGSLHFSGSMEDWILGNRNSVGRVFLFAGFGAFISIVFFSGLVQKISIGFFCFFFIMVMFTFSSRAIFAYSMLAFAVYWAIIVPKLRGRTAPLILFGALILGGLAVFLFLPVFDRQFDTLLFKLSNLFGLNIQQDTQAAVGGSGRRVLMVSAIALIAEKPILGWGLENSRHILGTFTHIDIIELSVSGGILAIVPFYAGHWILLVASLKLARSSPGLRLTVFVAFFSLMSLGLAGNLYRSIQVYVCFVALYLALLHRRRYVIRPT